MRFKPKAMILGMIAGILLVRRPSWGLTFIIFTMSIWLSYLYGYYRGESKMHTYIFSEIRAMFKIRNGGKKT